MKRIVKLKMPSQKRICLTRRASKRKLQELQHNAPIKKARLSLMKKLGTEYLKVDHNIRNNKFRFNKYYDEKKLIYPWLKKESLRWHIRQFNKDNCTNNYMSNNDSSQTQTNDLGCHVSHDIQDHLCVGKGFFI